MKVPRIYPIISSRLDAVQAGVQPIQRDQFGVRANSRPAAGFEHRDAVRVLNGREAVGDDDAGAALHQALQRLLHQALALAVERGGGLIEQQDARVFEDRAGDGDALALPAAELDAALADQVS